MQRKLRSRLRVVDQIMDVKYNIACDRDLLRKLLSFLRERIANLEEKYRKKRYNSLKRRIRKYRSIAGSIWQSIEAADALLRPPSNSNVSKIFGTIFKFFVARIISLKDVSHIFSGKFKELYKTFTQMVANVTELKKLVHA